MSRQIIFHAFRMLGTGLDFCVHIIMIHHVYTCFTPLKKNNPRTIDVLRSRSWGLTLQVRKLDLELRELKSQLACDSLALEPRCWRRDEGATMCFRCDNWDVYVQVKLGKMELINIT